MNYNLVSKINLAVGIIMVFVYLAAGTFILFYNFVLLSDVDVTIRKAVGILIIIYALFRLFRIVKKFRGSKDENEADE